MKNHYRLLLILAPFCFSLIGCSSTTTTNTAPAPAPIATTPEVTPLPNPDIKSSALPIPEKTPVGSATTAENIHAWSAHGAIAGNDDKKAWSATVYWKQLSAHNYALQLFGPVGVGTIKITGTPSHVTLVTSKGDRFESASAENLLAKQTGWNVPISNLYYWVRGLPAPNFSAKKSYDSQHRLSELHQDGWSVHYADYTMVNGAALPGKITLSNPPYRIKMVIKEWQAR
jgi:outer membrane lipoprotein LolB